MSNNKQYTVLKDLRIDIYHSEDYRCLHFLLGPSFSHPIQQLSSADQKGSHMYSVIFSVILVKINVDETS